MQYSAQHTELYNIAQIRTGYSFRGKIKPSDDSNAIYVLQPKDIDAGEIIDNPDKIDQFQINSIENHYLNHRDILIANKGIKFSSTLIGEEYEGAICSSSFFVISLHNHEILPEYLFWYLNQREALSYLKSNVSGSTIPSLTKKALESLEIPVIPLVDQESIIHMAQLVKSEREELKNLIQVREEYLSSYAWELIKK